MAKETKEMERKANLIWTAHIRDFDTIFNFDLKEEYAAFIGAYNRWQKHPKDRDLETEAEKRFCEFAGPYIERLGREMNVGHRFYLRDSGRIDLYFNGVKVVSGIPRREQYVDGYNPTIKFDAGRKFVARGILEREGTWKLRVIEDLFRGFYDGNGYSEPKVKVLSSQEKGEIHVATADWMPQVLQDMKRAYAMMKGKEFKELTNLLDGIPKVEGVAEKLLQSEYDQRLVRLRTQFKIDVLGKK